MSLESYNFAEDSLEKMRNDFTSIYAVTDEKFNKEEFDKNNLTIETNYIEGPLKDLTTKWKFEEIDSQHQHLVFLILRRLQLLMLEGFPLQRHLFVIYQVSRRQIIETYLFLFY